MENSTAISENALLTTICNSIQTLGRGFDVTSDIRLLYCKGAPGSRLVQIDEDHTQNLEIAENQVIPNVSIDIDCSKGRSSTETTPVLPFHEVSCPFILTLFASNLILSSGFFWSWLDTLPDDLGAISC